MQIGRKDIVWNFMATFMRVASGLIVLPLVLKLLPTQEVAIWSIFITIGSLATLLDFGFSNSFSRNITYIFSGAKTLKAKGHEIVENNDKGIDYGLLKSVIVSMRRYYGILALAFLAILFISSPFYLTTVLKQYSGSKTEVWISWFTYGALVAYQLYTYYYSSILTGRGLIKQVQQITIISHTCRIIVSVIFLLLGFGLISLVLGQLASDVVNRSLCYSAFYDKDIKKSFKDVALIPVGQIMKIMTPNAIRIGITTLGTFFIGKAIILIAPLYLTLPEIASYGITKQMIDLIMSIGSIWFATFYPKITLHRVKNEKEDIKRMYIKGNLTLIGTFIICGIGLVAIGPQLLLIIHSKTHLLSTLMILVLLISGFLDSNQNMATSFLLTGNEVPFMKSTLISGILSVSILFYCFYFTSLGMWGLLISPLIAQSIYQNWKWPFEVIKQINLRPIDYISTIYQLLRR
jgi:O-antigen/teichoic acid export membrane protein